MSDDIDSLRSPHLDDEGGLHRPCGMAVKLYKRLNHVASGCRFAALLISSIPEILFLSGADIVRYEINNMTGI
jgi:hypothetical protein